MRPALRSYRVDDPGGAQVPGRSGDRLTNRQPVRVGRRAQDPACREDRFAARTVDRAVDPAAAEQAPLRSGVVLVGIAILVSIGNKPNQNKSDLSATPSE